MGKGMIIFDFDGVLANSFESLYKINALAFRTLGKNLTKSQYRDFFIGDFNESLKKFCGNEENCRKLIDFKKNIKEKHYNAVKLFPHAKSFISQLKSRRVNLGIVSVNSESLIRNFLDKSGLTDYFDFILSSEGESKMDILKKSIQSNGYEIGKSYFVSDTFNDVRSGNKIGIKTIAVLWGFHKKDLLLKAKPDFICKNYKDFLRLSIVNQ